MKQSTRVSLAAVALSLGLVVLAPALAHAEVATDGSTTTTTTTSPTGTSQAQKRIDEAMRRQQKMLEQQRDQLKERARKAREQAVEASNGAEAVKEAGAVPSAEDLEALKKAAQENQPSPEDRKQALEVKGREIVERLKQERPEQVSRTAEEKTEACNNRKDAMDKRLKGLSMGSTQIQSKLDDALAKAVKYQQDKKLTSADLASAIATATAAQAKAKASLAALQAAVPEIDCEDPAATAEALAAFKAAVQQTRSDTDAYLKSLRSVMKQLADAKPVKAKKPAATTTTTQSTTTGTTTTTEGSN